MRKILVALAICLCVVLTGCSSNNIVETTGYIDYPESQFERKSMDDNYAYLIDKQTGVMYLEYKAGHGDCARYGISVMLNPDGTARVWEGYE